MRQLAALCGAVFSIALTPTFAITCPTYEAIQQIRFTSAAQHSQDHDLWYLFSNPFEHDKQTWNVTFGTFFYNELLSPSEALQKGQQYFDHSPLKIHHPKAVWIPSGVVCDYMTEGSSFWVSAVSPPQFQIDQFKK